jgi:hypothetical protein
MANTYKALSTVTVGAGGAASISFTNIPSTYTDLKLVFSLRSTRSVNFTQLGVRLNNSATGYTQRTLVGDGSAVTSSTPTTQYYAYEGMPINAANSTSNTFSSGEIYIPNYVSSNNKSGSVDFVSEQNATGASQSITATIWTNSSPITSIVLNEPNGATNFAQYSTATLYGVFNADVSSAPATPTIGTATAGNAQASITFTGVSNAASYTMTSTPSSITATGTSSPIVVTGLTNGTAYTFKVKSNNPFGSSAESAASNSVTPDLFNYDSISTVTVPSGGSATVSFTSIPQSYKHLQIRAVCRGEGSLSRPAIRFNSDSGNNYSQHGFTGNGSSGGTYGDVNISYIDCNICTTSSDTANVFGPMIIDIMDYSNASVKKTVRSLGGYQVGSSGYVALHSGVWNNTSAITRIDFVAGSASSGDYNEFTTFALYGLKG